MSLTTPPTFLNASTCSQWLEQLPAGNASQTQVQLLKQLNVLHDAGLPGSALLEVLEVLRETIAGVQDEAAKRYIGKPLPLSAPEQAVLDTGLALWHALARCYLRLLDQALDDEPGLDAALPQIAQRALAALADWQVELGRGQQLTDAPYWRLLHHVFTVAEPLGALNRKVSDTLRHGNTPTTALAAYGEALLLHTIHLHEQTPRLQIWLRRWIRLWGGKLTLTTDVVPVGGDSALPLWTDIAGDQPPATAAVMTPGCRCFNTGELRKSVKGRIALLDQGESPAKLKLGDDCTQPTTGALLRRAYQAWCKGGAGASGKQADTTADCELIAGLEAVHYYLSDRQPFNPPLRDAGVLRRDADAFAVLGEISKRKEANFSIDHGFEIQSWREVPHWPALERAANLVCVARAAGAGERIGAGTLIAVKLARSPHFVLGGIDWVVRDRSGDKPRIVIGVRLIPGTAKPVAATPTDVRDPYRQALYLAAVPGIKPEESLILPNGSFRMQRQIEFRLDKSLAKVTLSSILDRGSAFEHCGFRRSPA